MSHGDKDNRSNYEWIASNFSHAVHECSFCVPITGIFDYLSQKNYMNFLVSKLRNFVIFYDNGQLFHAIAQEQNNISKNAVIGTQNKYLAIPLPKKKKIGQVDSEKSLSPLQSLCKIRKFRKRDLKILAVVSSLNRHTTHIKSYCRDSSS